MDISNLEWKSRAELGEMRAETVERLKHLNNRGETTIGRARSGDRALTAAEIKTADTLFAEFEAAERDLAAIDDALANNKFANESRTDLQPLKVAPAKPLAPDGTRWDASAAVAPRDGPQSFRNLFPGARADTGGFRDFGEFAKCVRDRDPRLFSNASGMQSTVGSEGGFFIPSGFVAGLVDGSLQQECVRPRCTVIPVASSSALIPLFDTTTRSTGIAGLDGKLTLEAATAASQKATITTLELKPRKLVCLVPCTEELIADSPQVFGQLLRRYMVEAISARVDYEAFSGNGVGMMTGIITAPCTVSVAKESGQVNGTIYPANIAKMIARLAPGSFAKATWVVSPSALAQLFTLTQVTTNVAGNENVSGHAPEFFTVLPNGEFSLLGRPLIVSDRLPALGTVGDILLADLSQYAIGLRQDVSLAVDTSLGFREGEIYFKATLRIDGAPLLKSAITPRVGSDTLSPFVTLAAR